MIQFSTNHTWLRTIGRSVVGVVGISEFAQNELGEVVYLDLPDVGLKFEQNKIFGSIEAVKAVSDLFMPVSGTIIETNKNLLTMPTLINSDPYGEGWIIKIEIIDTTELKNLFTAEQYTQITKN